MYKISLICGLCLAILSGGCETNPITGEQQFVGFSALGLAPGTEEQKKIGSEYAPEIRKQLGGPIQDQQLQSYISQVGRSIAGAIGSKEFEFKYEALNDPMVNAFALPGGYVFITKGMLKQIKNEAQLAAILAHESAHVTQQHSAKQMGNQIGMGLILSTISVAAGEKGQMLTQVAQIGSQLITLKYSRTDETEADSVGLDYMVKAGYSPKGMLQVMQILQSEGGSGGISFLSTHPSPANRLESIQKWINTRYPLVAAKDLGSAPYQTNVLSRLK